MAISVEEFYKDLGDLTQQEKDDILRGLLLALANCPTYNEHNFPYKWDEWRKKIDYYLCFTTFGRIIGMLTELRRLRFIKQSMEEIREPLLKCEEAYILIDGTKYSADFLFSSLNLLDENVQYNS